jgi:hypothetical protein
VLHVDPAVELRNELLAGGNSPPNVRETYSALPLLSQGLRCSHDILDLESIISQGGKRYATRVSYLSAIEPGAN